MGIRIRPANLVSDRGRLISVLSKFLSSDLNGERFDWLYQDNPFGPARAWMAEDESGCGIVGVASAFPRIFQKGHKSFTSFVLGDFCVDPRFRSLGPAVQLQRACLGGVRENGIGLVYDFPSAAMVAVYSRLGMSTSERIVRHAKHLRMENLLARAIPWRGAARLIGAVFDKAIQVGEKKRCPAVGLSFESQEEACRQEFTDLLLQASLSLGPCLARTAEYLNWRYFRHPFKKYEMIVARRGIRLSAYVVYNVEGEDAAIVDLFGLPDVESLQSLLFFVLRVLRGRKVSMVSAPLLASHPWADTFSRAGFVPRESMPVLLSAGRSGTAENDVGKIRFLTEGDRDV
jgi:GNAT superfamily N-acetyltransferase